MLTQTFVQSRLVYHDIVEGIKEKFSGILKNYNRISALTMATKLITFVIVFAMFPMASSFAEQPLKETPTAITFSQTNPFALSLSDNKVPIEIGQSREDEEKAQVKNWVEVNGQMRPAESVSHQDPTEFRPIYQAAAQQFGIPWQLIEAVHQVETGKSGSTVDRSSAGAMGPMQFMPGTWRAYEVDGNGDGVADITDVTDAIYTAANYLAKSGADAGDIDGAIYNYNHSATYVNKVKTIAYEIGL